MRLPPSVTSASYQRYAGTISEVTEGEIVLAQCTEESRVEYGTSPHRRAPVIQAREGMRIPIAGIAAIQVCDPPPPTSPK